MKFKLKVIVIVQMLIIVSAFATFTIVEANENEIQWPTSWILIDSDPMENGISHDFRDVKYAFYGVDDKYLYFRLECYGSPNFTAEPESRYKWFIDVDDPHNMGQSGGKVYDAEYMLFVEDSPKPGGDGIGDIYLLNDVNDNGFIGDDWSDYLITPGKINNSSIASYRIENNSIDVCIKLTEISNPVCSYFTWATDQENPNIDQAPDIDRSDNYWDTNLSKADISIVKTDSADPVSPGDSFNYTLLVTNHGPHIAYDIKVIDDLPANLVFNSATPSPSGGNFPNLFWDIPMLSIGESYEISINITTCSNFTGLITNKAVANNGTHDPVVGNNQDTEKTIVIQTADISIEKTSDFIAPAHAGSLIVYTLNITNHGPELATNINVTDILPDGVTFVDAIPMADEIIGSEYRWFIPSIIAGESFIIKINVTVNESFYGIITNLAYVEEDSHDPDENNDEDDEEIIVVPVVNLSIEKTSEFNEPLHANDPVIYYLNVTNHGPDIALDVNVTDILPDGVTFSDSNLLPSGNNESTYWWIIASIDVNESIIIRVNVTVNEGFSGTITNTATVEDDSYDPDDDNNEDREDTNVDEEEDENNGGGGGGYSSSPGPDEYREPTAKTDGPYYGSVGEEIQFNGTDSHDNDENGESIERYDWKFSDTDKWHNDSGPKPTYTYNKSGRYNISLRVFDDEGISNINTTFALIIELNSPPSLPELTGPKNGTKNVYYNFTVVSTDQNEDDIKYTIDWGDGNTTESKFLPSGIPFNTAYKWRDSGKYRIIISADDNNTITTNDFTIEIIDPEPKPSKAKENNAIIPLFLLLLLILIIILYLLDKRRRDKKKTQQNPKAGAKPK